MKHQHQNMYSRYIHPARTLLLLTILVILCNFTAGNCSAEETSAATSPFQATSDYFDKISDRLEMRRQPDIAALNQFFAMMPKGGDIHHHYSGAIYVETYLDWVAAEGYFINRSTYTIATKASPQTISVAELRADTLTYQTLLSRWSDKDFGYYLRTQMPPDEQFFQTFHYFVKLAAKKHPGGSATAQTPCDSGKRSVPRNNAGVSWIRVL